MNNWALDHKMIPQCFSPRLLGERECQVWEKMYARYDSRCNNFTKTDQMLGLMHKCHNSRKCTFGNVSSKDSDQPACSCSLISILTGHILDSLGCKVPSCRQRSDCVGWFIIGCTHQKVCFHVAQTLMDRKIDLWKTRPLYLTCLLKSVQQ